MSKSKDERKSDPVVVNGLTLPRTRKVKLPHGVDWQDLAREKQERLDRESSDAE